MEIVYFLRCLDERGGGGVWGALRIWNSVGKVERKGWTLAVGTIVCLDVLAMAYGTYIEIKEDLALRLDLKIKGMTRY